MHWVTLLICLVAIGFLLWILTQVDFIDEQIKKWIRLVAYICAAFLILAWLAAALGHPLPIRFNP